MNRIDPIPPNGARYLRTWRAVMQPQMDDPCTSRGSITAVSAHLNEFHQRGVQDLASADGTVQYLVNRNQKVSVTSAASIILAARADPIFTCEMAVWRSPLPP